MVAVAAPQDPMVLWHTHLWLLTSELLPLESQAILLVPEIHRTRLHPSDYNSANKKSESHLIQHQ